MARSALVSAKLTIFLSLHAGETIEHREGPGVPVPHLERIFANESVPAGELHALVGDLQRLFGGVALREPRRPCGFRIRIELGRGSKSRPADSVRRDMHV